MTFAAPAPPFSTLVLLNPFKELLVERVHYVAFLCVSKFNYQESVLV